MKEVFKKHADVSFRINSQEEAQMVFDCFQDRLNRLNLHIEGHRNEWLNVKANRDNYDRYYGCTGYDCYGYGGYNCW